MNEPVNNINRNWERAVLNKLSKTVSVSREQNFTEEEKAQGRQNLGIEGEGGGTELFEVDKQYTTGAEMKAAYDAGKMLRLKALQGPGVYVYEDLAFFKDEGDYYEFWFSCVLDDEVRTDIYDSNSDDWITTFINVEGKEDKSNKVTSWSNTPTNGKYPSEKLVYDEIHPAVQSIQPQGGMLPNVFYNLGTLSGNTTFAFASATDNTIENEWMFQFTTPSTAPTITWPQAITGWAGGSAPTINASKTYQVSVVNGLGIIVEF